MSKSQVELQEFAEGFRTYYSSLNPTAGTPDEVFKIESVQISVPTAAQNIKGRIYIPTEKPNAEKFPLVLFSHGGALVSGDLETHDVMIRALALRLNAVVLAYDYTLAPEENALGQMEEAKAAFNWLYDHADQYNGDVNKFVGIGDSAGGQITANLSHISIGELDPLSYDNFSYVEDLKVANITHELKFYPKSEHGLIQYFKNKEAHPLGEQALDDGIEQLKKWLN